MIILNGSQLWVLKNMVIRLMLSLKTRNFFVLLRDCQLPKRAVLHVGSTACNFPLIFTTALFS
jgi:hypothetical protein